MRKNVSGQKVGAQLVSATDGSAFTGSVTVSVTGDAGTQATGSVGSGACTHEGNGYHTYAPAQAETNYDLIAFTFTGTGAVPATVQVYTRDYLATEATLTTVAGYLDTEIAAILADTNELQTDWANGGRLDLLIDAILADTAELQTDWVNGGRLDLLIDAILADTNELQTDLVNGGRLDLLIDAILADSSELQTDWADGGRLDLILDARSSQTSVDDLPTNAELATSQASSDDATLAAIAALNNLSAAQVNAEVVDALATDTYAEPAQGSPAATATLAYKIGLLYKALRNRKTQTASEFALYADDGTTKDHEAAVSDDGTTTEVGELATGA